jgi:hypothetical protein
MTEETISGPNDPSPELLAARGACADSVKAVRQAAFALCISEWALAASTARLIVEKDVGSAWHVVAGVVVIACVLFSVKHGAEWWNLRRSADRRGEGAGERR